jgi:organic hydroperoxide reductase OsmC/OhrA
MLKVTVGTMRMRVTARYRVDGSVLNDTVQAQMVGADTTLELESSDPPERVARVVRNAERGCFVLQALLNPVPITTTTTLRLARPKCVACPVAARYPSSAAPGPPGPRSAGD